MIGAGAIKYFENIFSAFNKSQMLDFFSFLPEGLQNADGLGHRPPSSATAGS